ncbi:MAG TPA: hypothetical protein VK866_00010 [Acidimicrobiales bacterium]|nr:hypothetical protein [Acidimicrobiales bacterium]
MGAGLLAVLLVGRGLTAAGGVDPIITVVGVIAAAAAVAAARGIRPVGWVLVGLTVALVVSPSGTELSFDLARPDERGWFAFAAAAMLAAGLGLVGGVALLVPRRLPGVAVALSAVVAPMAVAAVLVTIDPQPDLGAGLSPEERAALPVIDLVNYGYDQRDLPSDATGVQQLLLRNDSDLPHTFTVDATPDGGPEIDVYVPAGRDAVVEVDLTRPVDVYCAIGDHTPLGMVARLGG